MKPQNNLLAEPMLLPELPPPDTKQPEEARRYLFSSGVRHEALEQIIACLIDTVRPEKIFVADKYFRHTPDNPDLLIVLPDDADMSFDECHMIIAVQSGRLPPFTYTLHMSYDIYRRTNEGHIFYSVACSRENLLYDAGKRMLPLSLRERAKAIREKAHQDFYSGFTRGVSFLESAWYAYGKGEIELTAFMLQQAAELPLRSILLALTGQDLHSHSISKLCSCCRRCAPQLSELFPRDTVTGRRLLNLLDSAYIHARYRELAILEKTDIILLFEKIKAMHLAARQLFEEKLAAFSCK